MVVAADPIHAASRARAGQRVVVVDRDQLFAECLALAVDGDGWEGQAAADMGASWSGVRTVERLSELGADVLVLGLGSADDGLPAAIGELMARLPGTRILILGSLGDDRRLLGCLEAGACGCVFRDQSLAEMRRAIEDAARGETVLPPRAAGTVFARLGRLGRERRRRQRLERYSLTARELEVLRLIADGLSNQQIADRLHLSVHTVKNHVHKTLETLEVHCRWDAARLAVARGWLPERSALHWGPTAPLHRF